MVMAGVSRQAIGVHSGNSMAHIPGQPIAMDRRDCLTDDDDIKSELPHELHCNHLVHYTENTFAERIGLSDPDDFIFLPRQVPITISNSLRLSWWSPFPPDNWETEIQDNLPFVNTEDFGIGNSPAFNGDSLCGPIGIAVEWQHILVEYASGRGGLVADVELRILGTFLYTKEIMFGVLVCMRGDTEVTEFPLINAGGTEAFVPCSREYFIWKVYSTVGYNGGRPSDVFWTWDHLSFGFYNPTSDLRIRNKFCKLTTKTATPYRPKSRSLMNNRSWAEKNADGDIFGQLIAKRNQ